jgi:phage/plasmid-associated DNA primase
MTRTDYSKLPSKDANLFIAKTFIQDGVKTFYPMSNPTDSKSDLTLEQFRLIQEKKAVEWINSKNEKKSWRPLGIAVATSIELNFRYLDGFVCCVDIDDCVEVEKSPEYPKGEMGTWNIENTPEILKACPFTLSRNKKNPHYWFRVSGIDGEKLKNTPAGEKQFRNAPKNLAFCKDGELLINHTWEKKGGKVYNWDGEIPTIEWDDIKKLVKSDEVIKWEAKAQLHQKKSLFQEESDNEDETTEEDEFEEAEDKDNDGDTENESSGVCLILPKSKQKIAKVLKEVAIKEKQPNSDGVPDDITKGLIQLTKIKDCFSKERLSGTGDYKTGSWKRFTLAMCCAFGVYGKELWDSISKRGDGYNKIGNEKAWEECCKMKDKSVGKTLGMGSLMMWAREDNAALYNSIFNKKGIDWNRLTHYTFALALEKKLLQDVKGGSGKSKIVFTGKSKEMTGYIFNGFYWKELGIHNTDIKKVHFAEMYSEYLNEFFKVKSHYDVVKQASILGCISSLDNVAQRNMILEALKTERYVDKIEWNTKKHLFAFEDCIWDLEQGKFVEPNPEDYISWTCGYSYGDVKKDYKEKQEKFKQEYLHVVFDNADLEQYVLNLLSSFLKQENPEEKAYFWLGKGRNSKGTLTKFLMNAMGSYFGELKLGFYTNYDKGEDSPNNNLFELRYARVCNTSEVGEDNLDPNKAQRFLTQKFKTATGGDQMTARQPHQKEQIKFVLGHILIQTNLMPMIVGIEKEENISLRERVVIIPFPFSFVDDDELIKTNPKIYKKRKNEMKDMMDDPEMKLAFIRLLLENYKVYKTKGLVEPPIVKQGKLAYFKESDIVGRWFAANIEPDEEDPTALLSVKEDLLRAFWAVNANSHINQKNMIEKVIETYGKRQGKDGKGYYKSGASGFFLQGYKFVEKTVEVEEIVEEEVEEEDMD